jgi:TonB-dependent starch-binding outer membrane protein SusC
MTMKNLNRPLLRNIGHLFDKHYLLVWMLCTFGVAAAQNTGGRITGSVVSDKDGEPLTGVSILVKGTSKSAITDMNGNFSVNANAGQTIVFTFIGFEKLQATVTADKMNVRMKEAINTLDELVVIGYGTQRKKVNTGATLQIKGEELERQTTVSALHALQGSTPGVLITSTSGQPGASVNVTIRGKGTLTGANPLYIIDGVMGGDINSLSNSDIASIDVLKDAASCAIYGAQASNGVVIVTTKSGVGKARVSFESYYGVQNLAKKYEMLDASQYATVMNLQNINMGKAALYTDKTAFISKYADTDWLDEIFVEDAPIYSLNVGINGSSETSAYSMSVARTGQDGIVGGHDISSYERTNFRINSNHKLYDNKLTIGEHLNFVYINDHGIDVGGLYFNSLRAAFNTSPFLPMFDDNGNYLNNETGSTYNSTTWTPWFTGESNPYASMAISTKRSSSQRLFGDIYAELELLKGVKLKTSFGLNVYTGGSRSFTPVYELSMYTYNNKDFATQSLNRNRKWNWDNTLTYSRKLGDHGFTALIGMSMEEYQGEKMYIKNTDLVIADYEHAWIDNTTNTDIALFKYEGYPEEESMMMSYFGRLNYNFQEKYLFNATIRADGSSRFAASNRWGYFPSFSGGWILSSEDFMTDVTTIDFLKIRGSWGQVGNQNIKAWQYVAPITTADTYYYFGSGISENSLYSAGAAVDVVGAYPSRLSNPELKWETSEQTNVGFDAKLLSSRLDVSIEWYSKVSRDWLIQSPVLATAGADAPYINGGDVHNSGVELALIWNDRMGDFSYKVGINGSYNKNVVRDIPNSDGIIYGLANEIYSNAPAAYRKAEEGYPIGYFWGYQTDGIISTAEELAAYKAQFGNNTPQGSLIALGDVKYKEVQVDNKINENDKTMIGDPNPDYIFGFSLSGNWKGLDFSVIANGTAGNQIFQSYRNWSSQYSNYSTTILEAWNTRNTESSVPRLTTTNLNYQASDLFVQDGSFLRISNIQLGYDIAPLFHLKYLSKCRIYAAVQNALTISKYDGMDPEIGYGTDESTSGFDLGYYPRPRIVLAGVNITF